MPYTLITPPQSRERLDLQELWSYRELLYFLVWRDLKVRYRQTVIGAGWAVLQPFLMMVLFSLFLGYFARIPSEGLPYPIFYYSALLPWMYFANTLTNATHSIVENQRVITKVYFPRLFLPLVPVLSGLIDFGIAFTVLIGLMVAYGQMPSLAIFWMPLFLSLVVITAVGASLWLSALNVMYRDVRHAVPFCIQFWMFASPVAYPSSVIPDSWRWFYGLNPMAGTIEGFRWALTGHSHPSWMVLLVSSLMAVMLIYGGVRYFTKTEHAIADVV